MTKTALSIARQQMERQARVQGYNTIWEYVLSLGVMSYEDLAKCFGGCLSQAQVEIVLCTESVNAGRNAAFQRESFARYWIGMVKNKWQPSDGISFEVAHAMGAWARMAKMTESDPHSIVSNRVKNGEVAIPAGWIPITYNDPILKELFDGVDFANTDVSLYDNGGW